MLQNDNKVKKQTTINLFIFLNNKYIAKQARRKREIIPKLILIKKIAVPLIDK